MKYDAIFPYVDDIGQVAPVRGVQHKPTETAEEEALWHYNRAREHDGLRSARSLPCGMRFIPQEETDDVE